MFSQDYDFPDDVSEGEAENEYGNESSDDDDLKRILRHIASSDDVEPAEKEMEFQEMMEYELDKTVKLLEANRQRDIEGTSGAATLVRDLLALPSSSGDPSDIIVDPQLKVEETKLKLPGADGKRKKSVQFLDKPTEFYDDAYFDSDDEATGGESSAARSGPSKKHPVLTDDELFYDPKVDDEDQEWVDKQRKSYQPKPNQPQKSKPQTSAKKSVGDVPSTTDAVLNCPACMTTVCLDCQRHEVYHQQYRAMFVTNCSVDKSQTLRYKTKKQKRTKIDGDAEDREDGYHPVKCTECGTEVGVIDGDEVYHFFNVIASHP